MLHEEVKKYRELSGDTNPNTSISRIGGYLDGYEKALEQTRWIPVSERLPEENKSVIVSTEYGVVYPDARYTKKYGWEWAYEAGADYWEELEDEDVTAWMPLPEPYKVESEE